MSSVGVTAFEAHLADLSGRIAAHADRPETRARLPLVIRGLAADLPTKNCWTLAEHLGDADPHGVQHLVGRAGLDDDAAMAEVRSFVADYLADPDAVLVGDETGDCMQGSHTVGVQPQYTGTAGGTENAQVAVYLGYATRRGHTLIDRELYLPVSWTDDRARCAAAGVPADVGFATKPTLLGDMVDRALDTGLPASWVTADEVYGNDPKLARRLEARGLGYVLAIRSNRHLPIDARTSRTAAQLTAELPKRSWQKLSAGQGAHGPREYDWAWVALHPRIAVRPGSAPRRRARGVRGPTAGKPIHSPQWAQMVTDAEADTAATGRRWWLLVRRHPRSKDTTYYLCYCPKPTPLPTLVRVAGLRWRIEEGFHTSKGLNRPVLSRGSDLTRTEPCQHHASTPPNCGSERSASCWTPAPARATCP